MLEAASRQGIKVYGLSDSLVKKEDQNQSHTVILGYGGLKKEEIEKGIEALKKAWL